jgi:hypothetical protein
MDYTYQNLLGICNPEGYVALGAKVQAVVNAINTKTVIPYGDFGGPNVYWFQTFDNGLGNLVYTIFDKETTLGLASFMVRYGAASTIQQVVYQQYPRTQIDLQYLILPRIMSPTAKNGTVIGLPVTGRTVIG